MKLSLIAALADNRVIGRGGGLPWHLPGRRNLVLTRHPDTLPAGVEAVASLQAALAACADAAELCVIGGAELYRLALPLATRLELTQVHATIEGDVLFPEYDPAQWRELARSEHSADERHRWPMTFVTLARA